MWTFSQEMLRLLQPELLQPEEMLDILTKKGVPLSQLKHLDHSALLDVFRNTAVPKPQRKKYGSGCSNRSTSKNKNKIIINSNKDRLSSSSVNKNERRLSSSGCSDDKYCRPGFDRLKPPPDLSQSRKDSYLDRSQPSCRLKPPPDLSQSRNYASAERSQTSYSDTSRPEYKKVKLNRSSSQTCSSTKIIILTNGNEDPSKRTEEKLSNVPADKMALKRNSSTSLASEGPPKKRQPITWP